jgi:hypothetical protein
MLLMHNTLTHEITRARQAELALAQVRHELPAAPRRRLRLVPSARGERRGRVAHAA